MLTVCTLLWQPNGKSRDFSRCYSPAWVDKLYRGFARNLSAPFDFICYVDRPYEFAEPAIISSEVAGLGSRGYSDCIKPYEMGVPMILVGLDTIVIGNIDHLADYCLTADKPAYPVDPYHPYQICNAVGLIPAGFRRIAAEHRGENDMEWVRRFPHNRIDDLFPGHVISYKGHVKKKGVGDARIIYFHGQEKPHQLGHVNIVREHWI